MKPRNSRTNYWEKKKQLIEKYDILSSSYDDLYKGEQREKYNLLFNNFRHFLNANLILGDFGCGTGLLESYLQNEQVVGIDFSKKSLEIAKRKGKKPMYILADIEFPPFRKNCLDLIVMFTVIHHIRDPVDLIRKLSLLIRKAIIVSVLKKTENVKLLQTLIKSFPQAKVLNSQKSRDVIIVIEKTRVIQ